MHVTSCYLPWVSKIWRPLLSKADTNLPSCSYEMNYLCYYFSLATSPLVVCLTLAHLLENKDVFGCFWSVLVLVFADEVHCYTATHDDDIDGHDVFHPVKLISTRILHYSLCFHLDKIRKYLFQDEFIPWKGIYLIMKWFSWCPGRWCVRHWRLN